MPTSPTGAELDPGVVENIAALSPCPMCNADALSGPEGWGWSHLPHCWKCGYNWKKPATVPVNTPTLPALAPAQITSLATAVVAQLKAEGWTPPAAPQEAIDAGSTPASSITSGGAS